MNNLSEHLKFLQEELPIRHHRPEDLLKEPKEYLVSLIVDLRKQLAKAEDTASRLRYPDRTGQ